MSGRQVFVTGRGIISPLGVGFDQHWAGVLRGIPAIGPLPRLAELGLESTVGGEVRPEMLSAHLEKLPRKQQKLYNRMTLLAMIAAKLAMEDANLAPGDVDPTRLGVYLGINIVSWELELLLGYLDVSESASHRGEMDLAQANAYCMRSINPLEYSLKTLPNLTAGYVAIAYNAQGICRAYTDGAVGGLLAVSDAYEAIREGDLDVALCGGADAQLEELVYASTVGMGVVKQDDHAGTGIVPGEGSTLLVLEAEDHMAARGAVPHARILGTRSLLGGGRLAAETDRGVLAERIGRAMQGGLTAAGVSRTDLLALHRDGIPVVDEAETHAVEVLPASNRPRVRLALKPIYGHLGAAAAPSDILACSAMFGQGVMCDFLTKCSLSLPLVLVGKSDGETDSSGVEIPIEPVTAMVNAIGLFGEVGCLVLDAPGRPNAG